jgi:hypothetical protein
MHDAEELLKATTNQTGDKIGGVCARVEESLREARRKPVFIDNMMAGVR